MKTGLLKRKPDSEGASLEYGKAFKNRKALDDAYHLQNLRAYGQTLLDQSLSCHRGTMRCSVPVELLS